MDDIDNVYETLILMKEILIAFKALHRYYSKLMTTAKRMVCFVLGCPLICWTVYVLDFVVNIPIW
jgi:hypothetical protein